MGLFVGRDASLGALHDELTQARSGTPRQVLVCGEPGIGKSRLVREFAATLDPDVHVLLAHCLEASSTAVPLAPVQELVHRAYRRFGAEALRAAAGAYLPELALLEPALADVGAGAPEPSRHNRMHAAIRHLCEQLAGSNPLVLVVEDLHWADESTLDVLRYLTISAEDAAVLTLATVRTGTPAALARRADATRLGERVIELGELDVDASRRLASDLATTGPHRDQAGVERAVRASHGNPLYLEELMGAPGEDDLPDPLAALLLSRVSGLSSAARELVQRVSLGEAPLSYDALLTVTGWPEDTLDDVLHECREHAVLTASPSESVSLRHPLVGDAVRQQMDPGHRRSLHRDWAVALAESGDPSSPRTALVLAHHWQQAAEPVPAREAAWLGAHAAASLGAHATRAHLLDRVLELWPVTHADDTVGEDRLGVLTQSSRSHELAGHYETAAARLDTAIGMLGGEQPVQAASLLIARARVENRWHDVSPQPWLDRAAALLPESGHEGVRARLLAEQVDCLDIVTESALVAERASEALEVARAAGDQPTQAMCLRLLAEAYQVEDPHRAVQLQESAIVMADECGEYDTMVMAMAQLTATTAYVLGNLELAAEQIERFLRTARLRGVDNHRAAAFLLVGGAYASLDLGLLAKADAAAERALALLSEHGLGNFSRSVLATVRLIRGDLDGGRQQLACVVPSPMSDLHTAALDPQAWVVWLESGPSAAADVMVDHLQHLVDGSSTRALVFVGDQVIALARYLRLSGRNHDPDAAGVQTLMSIRRLLRPVLAHDPLLRVLDATLAPVEGRGPVECWRAAAAKGPPSAGLYWHVDTLLRLAETTSDRAEAQRCLDDAEVHARRMGSRAQLAEVEALRRRLADTPWPAGVTAREAEILALVARGLSNAQIGAELVISRSTVGVHISSILAKTGTSARMDAVAWARERGLL